MLYLQESNDFPYSNSNNIKKTLHVGRETTNIVGGITCYGYSFSIQTLFYIHKENKKLIL